MYYIHWNFHSNLTKQKKTQRYTYILKHVENIDDDHADYNYLHSTSTHCCLNKYTTRTLRLKNSTCGFKINNRAI